MSVAGRRRARTLVGWSWQRTECLRSCTVVSGRNLYDALGKSYSKITRFNKGQNHTPQIDQAGA
jgi:hypothetical protein